MDFDARGAVGDFFGETGLIEIDADADDGDFFICGIGEEFDEDATDFLFAEDEVVGPLELAVDGSGDGDGGGHPDEPWLFVVGVIRKWDAHGKRFAGAAVPGAVEPSSTLGLVESKNYGWGFARL